MKLIGMLDSPYVRRVAICAKCLGVALEHESVSVFRHFEQFQRINPVVKAPTLVLDDGNVLMDSTLIIDYLEALAAPGKSLMPVDLGQRLRSLRLIGLALAACEKSVQIYYERNLRPTEIQHAPGLNAWKANWRRPMECWNRNWRNSRWALMANSIRPASPWRWPGASPTWWCRTRCKANHSR